MNMLQRSLLAGAIALLPLTLVVAPARAQYVPPADNWEVRTPQSVGMNAAAIRAAVEFVRQADNPANRDQELSQAQSFGREPLGHGIGPFKVRDDPAGLIIRNGYIVAEWGDPDRVDMTHSVTKSFLSTTVGLAWQDGLIPDLDRTVRGYMPPIDLPIGDGEPGVDRNNFGGPDPVLLFESDHNRQITWRHLLQQNSDWEGTLWGKPDWADRPDRDPSNWLNTDRPAPGTRYEYNDTRVNLLALAAMSVVRKPLPQLLHERVMGPIGASSTWRWHGYENSWITLDGSRVQAVSGGGHWGGGMFINAKDMARFGLFTLRRGNWGGAQLLDEAWFDMATTPSGPNPGYGFMNFFLNRPNAEGRKMYPSAPDEAWAHLGNGTNMVYVDPVNDVVIVARWIAGGSIDDFIGMVLSSIEGAQ